MPYGIALAVLRGFISYITLQVRVLHLKNPMNLYIQKDYIRKDLASLISILALVSLLLHGSTQAYARPIHRIAENASESGISKIEAFSTAAVQDIAADDPSIIGQWSAVMDWPVVAIHASLLPNGKLLTWDATPDDFDGDPHLNDSSTMRTDLWDPATNVHLSYNPDTNSDMFCSGHAHLADGSLFVAGGDIADAQPIDKTNIFSWQDNRWSSASSMSYSRWYPSVAAMPNEEMLVIGGSPSIPEVWSAENSWRALSTAPLDLTMSYYHWIQPTLDGRALLFGPSPDMRFLDTTNTGAWTDIGRRDQLYRHYGIYAMYDVGKIMIAGGGITAQNSAVLLDVQSGEVTELPPMQYDRRQHNGTILADGKVLVSGGLSSSESLIDMNNPVYAAELWDPDTFAWTSMASTQVTRQYHSTALLLPNGQVWSGGGGYCLPCTQVGYEADSAEIFSPPYLFKADGSGQLADRPSIDFAPQNVAYGRTFDVSSANARDIAQVNLVRLSSVTHSTNMDQRFVPLSFDQNGQLLTIDAPDHAAIAPPGYYMLFIVNGAGVPSEAAFVRFYNSPDSPTLVPTPVIPEQLLAPTVDNIVNWPEYDSEFLVTWSAVENVTQYELETWSAETNWAPVEIVSAEEYRITDQPLGHWCFRVRSVREGALASSWSNNACTDVNEALESTPTDISTSRPTSTSVHTPTSTATSAPTSIQTPIISTETPTTIIEPTAIPTAIPTATAIPPAPTNTFVPTVTSTSTTLFIPTSVPTSVPTSTLPPIPTSTFGPTVTPTGTPTEAQEAEIMLTAPDLFKIDNEPDFDNFYTVEWSSVPRAENFNIEEWSGRSGWRSLGSTTQNRYEVREQDLGYWCYRVQTQDNSEWSVVRCTTVSIRRQTPISTSVSPTPSISQSTSTLTAAVTSTQVVISRPTSTSTPAFVSTRTATVESTASATPAIASTPIATPLPSMTSTPAATLMVTTVPPQTETPLPVATTGSTVTPIVVPDETTTATPINRLTPNNVEELTIPELLVLFDAEEIKNGDYTVQWSGVITEVGYELQAWTSRSGWVTILAGTFVKFDAQGYSAGTWCYRVRANSQSGSTEWSNVDCVSITPDVTLLSYSSDPVGRAVEMSITVAKTNIPQLEWQGKTNSSYHVWKSIDGRTENAVRLTVDQMDGVTPYLLEDISELAYIDKVGGRSNSTYWLVESRGLSTVVHGPFRAIQVEPVNLLYLPFVNQ